VEYFPARRDSNPACTRVLLTWYLAFSSHNQSWDNESDLTGVSRNLTRIQDSEDYTNLSEIAGSVSAGIENAFGSKIGF
jgi:hypothetical protein